MYGYLCVFHRVQEQMCVSLDALRIICMSVFVCTLSASMSMRERERERVCVCVCVFERACSSQRPAVVARY